MRFVIGILLSFVIAFSAYKKHALSLSGFFAAMLLGTALYFTGGFLYFSTMIVFFISSTVLSKIKKDTKSKEKVEVKGSCRDYIQVFANGGVALVLSVLFKIFDLQIFEIGVIISFAAANADTWASEIGSRSKQTPVYLFKKTPVTVGLSGGVTKTGIIASLAGSFLISLWYIVFCTVVKGFYVERLSLLLIITIAGFLGSIIDSMLGEKIQVKYVSWKDEMKITEKRFEEHIENKIASGIRWVDNNVVNFISSVLASIIGMLSLVWI